MNTKEVKEEQYNPWKLVNNKWSYDYDWEGVIDFGEHLMWVLESIEGDQPDATIRITIEYFPEGVDD